MYPLLNAVTVHVDSCDNLQTIGPCPAAQKMCATQCSSLTKIICGNTLDHVDIHGSLSATILGAVDRVRTLNAACCQGIDSIDNFCRLTDCDLSHTRIALPVGLCTSLKRLVYHSCPGPFDGALFSSDIRHLDLSYSQVAIDARLLTACYSLSLRGCPNVANVYALSRVPVLDLQNCGAGDLCVEQFDHVLHLSIGPSRSTATAPCLPMVRHLTLYKFTQLVVVDTSCLPQIQHLTLVKCGVLVAVRRTRPSITMSRRQCPLLSEF